jgi:hypothetical protein
MSFGRDFERAFEQAEEVFEAVEQKLENDFSNMNMNMGMGNEHHNRHGHHNQHQQNHMNFGGGQQHHGNHGHHGNQGSNFLAQEIFAEESAELMALRIQREQEAAQLRQMQAAARQQELALEAEAQRQQAIRDAEAQRQQAIRDAEARRIQAIEDAKAQVEYEKQQAILANERRIAAERAEQHRRAEQKRQAELAQRAKLEAEQEEKNEDQRLAVYNAHQNLIAHAANLSYLELEKELNALGTLTEPSARFEKTAKKGLPLDNSNTLFYQIMMNAKLASEQKYLLLDIMLTKLGYLAHIHLLFSTPIIEMLLNDATPSKLLEPLYNRAVFTLGMALVSEPQIWFRLITSDPTFANRMLETLFAGTLGNQKIMQFIDYWRSIQVFGVVGAFEGFYAELLTRYKAQIQPDLFALIEANFLTVTQNNWGDFISVCIAASVTTELMLQTFQRWALTLVPEDIANTARFVNSFEIFLSNRILDPNLHIDASLLQKLYPIDESACSHIYTHLNQVKASPQLLLPFLVNWVAAYQLPHDFSAVRQHYFELMKAHNVKTQLNQEEKIWEALIKSNVANGPLIFDELVNRHADADKLMEFTKCWMQALTRQHDISSADAHIELRVKQASLQRLAGDFKLITEIYTLRRAAESKGEDDDNTVKMSKALLESSKVGLLSQIFQHADKKHAPYDIYHQLRHKEEHAKAHLAEEERIAAQHINADLEKEGVKGQFTFS